jgi:Ser-tRNA(Ala) deacylase AlaX
MTVKKQKSKVDKENTKITKASLDSYETGISKLIYEKLNAIDPQIMEEELRALAHEIEATNARLEKAKCITHETLKLVVGI